MNGPYSQDIKYNGVLYVLGTMPINSITGKVAEGRIEEQVRCALDYLGAVLEAGRVFLTLRSNVHFLFRVLMI